MVLLTRAKRSLPRRLGSFRMCWLAGFLLLLLLLCISSQNGYPALQPDELLLSTLQNDPTSTTTNKRNGLLIERPTSNNNDKSTITIGYAVSLIKCGDKQSTSAGLVDAALILRHSIDIIAKQSKYYKKYKMYALVHQKAVDCATPLQTAGFAVMVHSNPVERDQIEGDFLRSKIHREWCCGEDEFIKLYAYQLHDVDLVVHVDMDFVFVRNMDHVFDSMLYDKDSPIGRAARQQVEVEFPNELAWPENIQAVMTRDWPQVMPGRKAGYQAGFIVAKPNDTVFETIVNVIRKGHYVEGYSRENGWGGKGYGQFVGAMAMQGLIAYVYDELLNDTWVELNQCRFNHFGMDVLYRNPPSFQPGHAKRGKCRNDREYCEDCMVTNLTDIYSIHYTMCRKPWNCVGEGSRGNRKGFETIPEDQVHFDHCMELIHVWHSVRTDYENRLYQLTGDETIKEQQTGEYKTDVFQGHCNENGASGYRPLTSNEATLRRVPELYVSTA